jgi:GNAT superfamily N-acetyltransferase
MVVREYRDDDAESVGRLIADTYSKFNLSFVPPEDRALFLGPFKHAGSLEASHREAIAQAIRAEMVFAAEEGGEIIGVLRGKSDKLQSLFVREDHHRRGVGRRLVERFERECAQQGAGTIKVQATLYAIPFYLAMGYKRSTGVRQMRSFDGSGFKYQPMKKSLHDSPVEQEKVAEADS